MHKEPHQNSDPEKAFVWHVNKASDIIIKGVDATVIATGFGDLFFFPSKFIPGQSPKFPRQMEWFIV